MLGLNFKFFYFILCGPEKLTSVSHKAVRKLNKKKKTKTLCVTPHYAELSLLNRKGLGDISICGLD